MEEKNIIQLLQKQGERITPVRRELIKIFLRNSAPLSPPELLVRLNKKNLTINKTTVYRQLEMLRKIGLIQEVQLADRAKRYELKGKNHHHHAVCLECGRVEDVSFPSDLKKQEQKIWQKTKFKTLRHSLEFFGVCKVCGEKK